MAYVRAKVSVNHGADETCHLIFVQTEAESIGFIQTDGISMPEIL